MTTLVEAINGYKNNARNLLLTNGALDSARIELVYKLDQAAVTVEHLLNAQTPFTVEITSENLNNIYDQADNMDYRFRDHWLEIVGKITLLMNYSN